MTLRTSKQPVKFTKRRLVPPLILLILLLVSIAAMRSLNAWRTLSEDMQQLEAMARGDPAGMMERERLTQVDNLFAQTDQDLQSFVATLGPSLYVSPLFGWVPRFGGDLANASALVDLAGHTISSARGTLAIALALDNALGSPSTLKESPATTIANVARSQVGAIDQARLELKNAAQARSRIDVAQLSPQSQKWVMQFDQFSPQWEALLGNLAIAAPLLGLDGPRVYLLLMQNDDELRATGGFITAVALLRLDHGQISLSNFEDSGEINGELALHPLPPAALDKFMFAPVWVLRDANWSPDFPTVASITQGMYRVDRRISMDGVIAVNLGMVPKMVDVWGPITLPGQGAPVDARNVVSMLESFKGQTYEGGHRKAILLDLLQEIVRRISSGNFDRARLARVMYESMIAKDLLVYVNDITLNRRLPAWQSGALYAGPGDALMIVDSNVGWNKVDHNVERHAEYVVSVDEANQATASLSITYTNLSAAATDTCLHRPQFGAQYTELQQGCYYNYVRVVAPADSQLMGPSEGLETSPEYPVEGRAVFGGYFVVPRGQTRTIRFAYTLPPVSPDSSSYTLHLEKQPGASAIPVRVRILLPETLHVKSARPLPVYLADREAEFELTLDRDYTIVLDLSSARPSAGALLFAGATSSALLFALIVRRRRWRPHKQA